MYHKSLWAFVLVFSLATVAAAAPPADLPSAPAGAAVDVGQFLTDTAPADPDWSVYPRLSLTHETGPGVGYNEGFTTFEGMIPLFQRPQQSLFFADLRGILSDDTLLGVNAGAGYRLFDPALNRVFGVNIYYDNRDTGQATFNQVGAGFESLGCWWDFRVNGYLPVGTGHAQVGDAFLNPQLQTTTTTNTTVDCSNPFFAGHNLFFEQDAAVTTTQMLHQDHVRTFEAAMKGFDMEAGVPLWRYVNLWAYAGTYCFEADGSPQAWGARGRLEARPYRDIILNLVVQNDRIFNTTVTFQGGFTWGGLRGWRHVPCTASDRLGDRVQRNYDIVVTQQTTHQAVSSLVASNTTTTATPVAAIDPATGLALFFDHADSNAAAGGNGAFEHPFNNLMALQTGSHPGDILYVHGGSVFDGSINPLNQGFTLQDNQRFLGEAPGCPHTVNTQCGAIVLPAVNGGPAPIIDSSNGNSITLANNNEVSGFNITSSGALSTTAHGIYGEGITNFNINCNTIGLSQFGQIAAAAKVLPASPAKGDSSVFLQNTQGTGLITGNILHAEASAFDPFTDSDAIHIENHGTTALNVTISGNTITGGAGNQGFNNGISLSTTNASRVTATITGNSIINNAAGNFYYAGSLFANGAGVNLMTADASFMRALISGGNNISGNLADGIDLFASNSLKASIVNNTFTGNGNVGIHSEVDSPGIEEDMSITGNTFNTNQTRAVEVFGGTMTGAATVGLRLTANTSDNNYLLDNVTNGTGVFNVENRPGANLGNFGPGLVTTNPPGFPPAFFTFVPPNSVPVQP